MTQLPSAAWALAWSCLAGQVVLLLEVGARDPGAADTVLSMLLSALVVCWVSAGVLAARTGRLVVVWLLFAVMLVGDVAVLLDVGTDGVLAWPAAHLALSVVQIAALAWFTSTPYFRWQRTRPRVAGPSLRPLLGIAAAVGLLGGLTSSVVHRAPVHVQLSGVAAPSQPSARLG